MESISPYHFIHIGLVVRLLRHCQGFAINTLISESNKLFEILVRSQFPVSVAGSKELKDFVSKLQKDQNTQRIVSLQEISELSSIMNQLENIIYAEASTKKIYVVSEKRFSLESLMEYPDRMFADKVFKKINIISKYDFSEGFSCLVFSRATAGAFHMLRGTESVLRSYYHHKIKRGREKEPTWAGIIKVLSSKKKKNEKLLQKLDFIRSNYRNPTAHPEAIYNVERLQDLIGLCIDVVNEIANELPELAD